MDFARRLVFFVALLLAAVALAADQQPTVIRVSDAVGDTIDLAERDSFRLFPNTIGFQHATIIELPKPEILADVTLADGDSTRRVFYRLVPSQLERIRFLVDNRDFVAKQRESDSGAAQTLATFWQSIEEHPFRNMASESANARNLAQPRPREGSAGGSTLYDNSEDRYFYALDGTTCGSFAGGCIGSWSGITYVRTEQPTGCEPAIDVYHFAPCVFWGAACGLTALGAGAGYAIGEKLDRERSGQMKRLKEGTNWRTGCCIGALVPGLALGYYAYWTLGMTMYGRLTEPFIRIENAPGAAILLPAAFTGLCITVEAATIGYRVAREIDHREAEAAEARRRALGREAQP